VDSPTLASTFKEVTMYASIRQGTVNPGQVKEFAQVLRDEIAPTMAKIGGFVGYYAVDLGDNRLMGISLFEDLAGAEEASRQASEYGKTKLQRFLAEPLTVSSGQVVVEKVRQPV
jgi:quinol monooxygenase YgiN